MTRNHNTIDDSTMREVVKGLRGWSRSAHTRDLYMGATSLAETLEVTAAHVEAQAAEIARMREALFRIIGMSDQIAIAPATAERWADRIEETARAAFNGEAKP